MKIKRLNVVLFVLAAIFAVSITLLVVGCEEEHIHTWDSGVVTTEATHIQTGVMTYTCTSCGENKTETIEKNDEHTYINGKCECGNLMDEVYCNEIYNKLLAVLLSMDNRLKDIDTIEEYITMLPLDYKDVETISEQLIFVKTQYEVFSDANYRYFMKMLVSSDEKSQYYIDYAAVSKAYFNLLEKDTAYEKWDLKRAANSWIEDMDDTNINLVTISILYYGTWTDSAGNYFYVIENDSNETSLYSNLPSDKVSGTTYYYSCSGKTFKFTSADGTQTITAYKITDVSENYIKVLCYSNSKIYTLYKS